MRRPAVIVAILALGLLSATLADAELTQKGDLFVRFDGGISPRTLPRRAAAPIAVNIDATIRVPAGHDPPPLRHIRIALNRGGHLNTRGLPVCRRQQVEAADTQQALAACQSALVGAGGIVAKTSFPGQSSYVLRGDLLLFNGVEGGRAAILAHVSQGEPAPITEIIVFHIHRSRGAFGTVLTADLPPSLNRNGYLTSIFLQLQRRYVFRGRPRSYLSASCAAPPGFLSATFAFARASMTFADGRTLGSTLIRSCRVRG